MELQKLDAAFQPTEVIDDNRYESLIWTERYTTAGDFELVSSDISRCMALLPRESYVTLRESTVPMIVESYKIVKGKNSVPKIEIRGRSFESVLERRASVISAADVGARGAWANDAVKSSDAAFHAIRGVIGDTFKNIGGVSLGSQTPALSPLDAIPQISLVAPADIAMNIAPEWNNSTVYAPGTQVKRTTGTAPNQVVTIYRSLTSATGADPVSYPTYWTNLGVLGKVEIKAGNLYSTVLELIQSNRHGIKATRPPNGSTRGTVDIEIYNGADLTNSTVFDVKFDQFDDATYLLSAQGSTNMAYVYGGGPSTNSGNGVYGGATFVRKNNGGAEVSGLNRRVLLIDEQTDNTLNTPAIRTSRGLVELYKNNAIALFDGQLAQQIADLYNKNVNAGGYSLGDIVQLNGDYGLSSKVRVVEFMRSFDSTGDKAFPAFEVIEE